MATNRASAPTPFGVGEVAAGRKPSGVSPVSRDAQRIASRATLFQSAIPNPKSEILSISDPLSSRNCTIELVRSPPRTRGGLGRGSSAEHPAPTTDRTCPRPKQPRRYTACPERVASVNLNQSESLTHQVFRSYTPPMS